jgi:NAD(P)-dependent dehydrogenase (short-subunit alcohol dehydrogenase family)
MMAKYLIVGGGSSIGQAVANLLLEDGHSVKTSARNDQKISADFVLDATDFLAVDAMFKEIGTLDGVVNCAGSFLLKPAHLTSKEEWFATINASLTTSFAIVSSAGRYMTQGGSVVLVGSAAAEIGLVNHEAIAAAKAGIRGLALSAAATYASHGLRFNVVEPGLTMTGLTQGLWSNEVLKQASVGMHPLGRLGTPEDIARAIVFFLLPENNWITGQCLAVDGGLSTIKPKMKS